MNGKVTRISHVCQEVIMFAWKISALTHGMKVMARTRTTSRIWPMRRRRLEKRPSLKTESLSVRQLNPMPIWQKTMEVRTTAVDCIHSCVSGSLMFPVLPKRV